MQQTAHVTDYTAFFLKWTGMALSVLPLAIGWTNPGGGEIFPHPSRLALGLIPASYIMSTGSFLGVKWTERDFDHSPTSSAKIKERAPIHLLPLRVFMTCSRMNFTFTFTQY